MRAWRRQNPDLAKKRAREYAFRARKKHHKRIRAREKQQYATKRAFLDWLKLGVGCMDCGYALHPAALEFDHVRGVKVRGVGQMIHASARSLQLEILKCEVVCSNCHHIRTVTRQQHSK
jgi:hypothetical protein